MHILETIWVATVPSLDMKSIRPFIPKFMSSVVPISGRDRRWFSKVHAQSIPLFAMITGGWGPASDEEGDVGMEHFYYPALMEL